MEYDLTLSDRIRRLKDKREWYNEGHLRLNTERTRILTEYCKAHEAEYPILKRASFLYEWCKNREVNIEDEDILLSSSGPRMRTVNFNIEAGSSRWIKMCLGDTDENFKAAWQAPAACGWTTRSGPCFSTRPNTGRTRTSEATSGALCRRISTSTPATGVSDIHPYRTFTMPEGHFVANFEKAVKVGFGAVRRQALEKIAEIEENVTWQNAKSHAFYRAVVKLCDGAILMSKRYAAACREKAAAAADPKRKAELLRFADSCDWIMENPARNLWEGLQVILFYQTVITADGQQHGQSIANVDRYVGELLDHDLATGALTRAEAQELFDAFILRIGDLIMLYASPPNEELIKLNKEGRSLFNTLGTDHTISGGIHITIGGLKPDGSSGYNTASELMLLSFRRLVVPDPSVCIRVNEHTPDIIWKLAIETSKLAGGIPQFDNDAVIIRSLVERGIPLEDAREYGIIGCVEPTVPGKEWPCCGTTGSFGGVTLISVLNLCIHGNKNPMTGGEGWLPCKKLYEYESFEELKAEYERQVNFYIAFEQKIFHFFEVVYSEFFPCISASVMMDGCMESGKDVTWGGAKYNAVGVMTNTFANTADSLMTIKKLCFDTKKVSLRELYDALCANWEGYESLRQMILNEVPHYGNDIDEVDELARWCSDVYADNLMSYTGPRDCAMAAGSLTLTANVIIGKNTSATPDGRRAGEPMADAISPRQGAAMNGPVSYVKSAAKLSHHKFSNGNQLNIRFDPRSVEGDEGTGKLRELIQAYFDLGGLQLQFNVVATEELRKAQKDPIAYKDLIVRIAGFSTYFVHMTPDVQEDFINRSEQFV
jgi:formate C-acetyltransferase